MNVKVFGYNVHVETLVIGAILGILICRNLLCGCSLVEGMDDQAANAANNMADAIGGAVEESKKQSEDEEKKDELPKLLSIAQAPDHPNCSIRTIRYYLYEAKNLPYLILGKEARIRESDLSGFIENLLKGQSSSNKELL